MLLTPTYTLSMHFSTAVFFISACTVMTRGFALSCTVLLCCVIVYCPCIRRVSLVPRIQPCSALDRENEASYVKIQVQTLANYTEASEQCQSVASGVLGKIGLQDFQWATAASSAVLRVAVQCRTIATRTFERWNVDCVGANSIIKTTQETALGIA